LIRVRYRAGALDDVVRAIALSANADPTPVASVCICTLARPKGLSRLLTALAQQIDAPPFEVVVVDNDARATAGDVVEPFRGRLRLYHFVQPVRGLTNARNMAVERSVGRYVAFIDDDEWPSPDWLANLHRMATNRGADAVFGPVLVKFAEGVPRHVRGCWLFTHQLPEHGAPVPWQKTRTANAYVRRAALPNPSRPFRDVFNLTGGEDCDLFKRMLDNGAVVIAAADAVVYEHRPLRRSNTLWCLRRAFRNGGMETELLWGGMELPARRRAAAAMARRELLHSLKRLIRPKGELRFNYLLVIQMALGRVAYAYGVRYEEYKRTDRFDEEAP
jgi:succinoglycan biosynthesis protein ExoM